MSRILLSLLAFSALVIVSCTGESKTSDQEKIEKNLRTYFFLSDSVAVNYEITDTLTSPELEDLIKSVENNKLLIAQDLDTLSTMIDAQAYKKLDLEKTTASSDALLSATNQLLLLQLKQAQLLMKKESFEQTNRILLNLKRTIWADIAGFNVAVHYVLNGQKFEFDMMLDANFYPVN
jgi:hypothetical protein